MSEKIIKHIKKTDTVSNTFTKGYNAAVLKDNRPKSVLQKKQALSSSDNRLLREPQTKIPKRVIQLNRRDRQGLNSQKFMAKMQKQQHQHSSRKPKEKKVRSREQEMPFTVPRTTNMPNHQTERRQTSSNRQSSGRGKGTPGLTLSHLLLMLFMLLSMVPGASANALPHNNRSSTRYQNNMFSPPSFEHFGNSSSLQSYSPGGYFSPQLTTPVSGLGKSQLNLLPDEQFRLSERNQLNKRKKSLNQKPLNAKVLLEKDSIHDQLGQLDSMSVSDYRNRAQSKTNPTKGKGHVVGLVGLPGSGKSVLQKGFKDIGFVGDDKFDDIGQNWEQLDKDFRWYNPLTWPRLNFMKWPNQRAETSVKTHAERNDNVIMSDPEFVTSNTRDSTEKRVGKQIEWTYFDNDPEQAEDNAIFRKENAVSDYDKSRDLNVEKEKIKDLSKRYEIPQGTPTHPIVNARKKYGKNEKDEKNK